MTEQPTFARALVKPRIRPLGLDAIQVATLTAEIEALCERVCKQRVSAAVRVIALAVDKVEQIATSIRPPNSATPELLLLAKSMRDAIRAPAERPAPAGPQKQDSMRGIGVEQPTQDTGEPGCGHLFVRGEFTAHSGGTLPFKIDCDALTDADIETLAAEIARRFRFGTVLSIPRGGVRLGEALAKHADSGCHATLIVDDVLTTGHSMEAARADLGDDILVKGVVIFARGPCPDWITPLFRHDDGQSLEAVADGRPLAYGLALGNASDRPVPSALASTGEQPDEYEWARAQVSKVVARYLKNQDCGCPDMIEDLARILTPEHFPGSTGEQPDCGAGWRLIESAPKDGTFVLTCIAGTLIPFVAAFDDDDQDACWFTFNRAYEIAYRDQRKYEPTHWMPFLPAPPTDAGGLSSTETEEDFGKGSA